VIDIIMKSKPTKKLATIHPAPMADRTDTTQMTALRVYIWLAEFGADKTASSSKLILPFSSICIVKRWELSMYKTGSRSRAVMSRKFNISGRSGSYIQSSQEGVILLHISTIFNALLQYNPNMRSVSLASIFEQCVGDPSLSSIF
jgi:hypothetical protein